MKNKRMSLVVVMLVLASAMLFAVDGYISREKAMEIALADAGVEKGQASFVRSHLDRDDGRMIYDVEFYVADMEYDYEIDAVDGEILAQDRDAEYWGERGRNEVSISEEEATRIALDDAKVTDTLYVRTNLDRDDGRFVYEIEFGTQDREYEYKIDAASGRIRETDIERVKRTSVSDAKVSIEEAAAMVMERIGDGIGRDDIRIRQDRDDGRIVYEGDAWYGKYEYEFEIDAATGRFRDWERERIDW